jgi:hypothetical protein
MCHTHSSIMLSFCKFCTWFQVGVNLLEVVDPDIFHRARFSFDPKILVGYIQVQIGATKPCDLLKRFEEPVKGLSYAAVQWLCPGLGRQV